MYKPYFTYKAEDFLVDDYFVDTMLTPTPQSERFWKMLVDENKIDISEFLSAYSALKVLHENKPDVSGERLDMLWEQINKTSQQKTFRVKRIHFMHYVAVACCVIFIASLSLFNVLDSEKEIESTLSIADFAKENIIHTEHPTDNIQVVSGSEILTIDGVQAKVEHDADGKMKVNKQTIGKAEATTFNQLKVPYGKRAFLKLSDGTSLWVNTGTTVVYPTVFAKDKREIYVEGEVFAEVFHNPQHPFIIKTKKLDIQVLGTSFNLSAYGEDKQTDVVLVSGRINVTPKNRESIVISPNQLFSLTDKSSTLKEVDVDDFISWHNGNYIFHNEPVENILLRLSRYYNVTMVLPIQSSGIFCSGKLELKEDLLQLLNGLSNLTDMNFAVKDNEYRIVFN